MPHLRRDAYWYDLLVSTAVQDAAKYAGEGGYCTGLNRTDRVVVARRTR